MENKLYKELFTVSEHAIDRYICTAHNDQATVIHCDFLEAYDLYEGDAFVCSVDQGGCIVLETIKKL